MRSVLFGIVVAASASAGTPIMNFPADGKDLRSPDGSMRVYEVILPAGPDEIPWHSLRLEKADHRSKEIDRFLRNVDVAWSSSGDMFYVSDYIGSNIAECYLFKTGRRTQKANLTDTLRKSSSRLARLMKQADHAYVECEGWVAPDKIRVIATGHGGKFSTWFEYRFAFVYDAKSDAATQVEASVKRTP